MSVALYIVAEREVEGIDLFVDGKALGHADGEVIESICTALGVRPLMQFCSQNPEELVEFMEAEGLDIPGPPSEEQWFDPSDGLRTVRSLLDHLRKVPNAMERSDRIVGDLEDFESVLMLLEAEGIRWHLAVDF